MMAPFGPGGITVSPVRCTRCSDTGIIHTTWKRGRTRAGCEWLEMYGVVCQCRKGKGARCREWPEGTQ